MTTEIPTIQSSQAEVWYLKPITYKGKEVQIITQNFNGPCSFIAICNILILRDNIQILPPTRKTVSYEHLSQLVAEYLLIHSPHVDISDALSIMPHTQKGLDLNPLFSSPTAFRPATDTAGAELKLFSQVGIHLVHGWLVSPGSEEAYALEREGIKDYDSAVAFIAEADFLGGGVVVGGEGERRTDANIGREWTDEEKRKIRNALTIRNFLESTQSQLTYHGLFHLASELPPGTLVALFRNSHLSVLLKKSDVELQPLYELQDEERSQPLPAMKNGNEAYTTDSDMDNSNSQHIPAFNSSVNIGTSPQLMPESQAHSRSISKPIAPSEIPLPSSAPPSKLTTPLVTPATLPLVDIASQTTSGYAPSGSVTGSTQVSQHIEITSSQASEAQRSLQPIQSSSSAQSSLARTSHFPQDMPERTPKNQAQMASASAIYTLVTDQVFLQEPSVVWERIEDVDGAAGWFVDGTFRKSSPAGGDWAGRTAEEAAQAFQDAENATVRATQGFLGMEGQSDHELAQQLQAEEEHYARQEQMYRREQERLAQHGHGRGIDAQRAEEVRHQKALQKRREEAKKKEKNCIIM